jgi:formylglycine-generating enzyme
LRLVGVGALFVVALSRCAGERPPPIRPAPEPAPPPPAPPPPCPADMVPLDLENAKSCIDRYEASLEERLPSGEIRPWPGNHAPEQTPGLVAVSRAGVNPQGYISGRQAQRACEAAGKRLCHLEEWRAACRGPEHTTYPYGAARKVGACNDRDRSLQGHPVKRLFQLYGGHGAKKASMWSPAFMNDPRLHELEGTVSPTGSFLECTNAIGALDLVGNLHEWIDDPQGTFVGGYFMDTFQNGEGCNYRTTAHGFDYHDYSTGFRCCAEQRVPSL